MVSIILIRPQMGENIGAAARVCKNFGLSDLRIVAPRDGWPNPKAIDMAAHAKDVIEAAKIYESTQDAVADLHLVYAATARDRAVEKPCFSPKEVMEKVQPDMKTGVLFGPERTGLENEDIAHCNAILSIDVNAEYPSLNLAQAVAVVAYESMASQHVKTTAKRQDKKLATKKDLQSLFDHLEGELDTRNFWRVEHKKEQMWLNIRAMFQRTDLTDQEVRTLRGIITSLTK